MSSFSAVREVINDVKNNGNFRSLYEDKKRQEQFGSPSSSLSAKVVPDPFDLVKKDLELLAENVKSLVATDHPVLATVAKYFFDLSGKRFRPTIILLISRALRAHALATGYTFQSTSQSKSEEDILESQRRLAEITEMIHTASIVHDDVIDFADTRRGIRSANSQFGNKVAVLAGDFLLARASVALARLQSCDVVELLSTVIEDLVRGEIMQMKAALSSDSNSFNYYETKTYLKTASLIAKSCQAAAVLADHPPHMVEAAYSFGKHLGLAYQYIDDVLDYTGTEKSLGKAPFIDLRHGIATAPVLFAQAEHPALTPIILRCFSLPGDVDMAINLVQKSSGIDQARALAESHCLLAAEALASFTPSPSQQALLEIIRRVLSRQR